MDRLGGGRFALGIGIGWSREEFGALGVPFERRAARTADYVAAMRSIWCDDIASYAGEFTNFDAIRVYPKPHRRRRIPILCGGNSDAALRRVARWGDGWYGFNLRDVDDVAAKVTTLRTLCEQAGRDPAELRLAVSLREPRPWEVDRLAELGVDELVLVASPPQDPAAVAQWLADLSTDWQ
jgi:alkanesulfonate monooxygenase SsuD/methylene tetrahydromethanopterin reductase-like flavin-dependent oxidoreductase (luciferase family)